MTVNLGRGALRAIRAVGDLDHPFYDEERQRDVWNEASAVGLQAMLWGTLGLTCAMAWFGGDEVFPWAVVLLAVVGVASVLTVAYARHLGVTGFESFRFVRPRMVAFVVLYVATLAGLVFSSGADVSLATVAGAVVGVLLVAGVLALVRNRVAREEA